ncbi:hypothetical protein GCM10028771_30150 [Nocardioides marmoraquaticus]
MPTGIAVPIDGVSTTNQRPPSERHQSAAARTATTLTAIASATPMRIAGTGVADEGSGSAARPLVSTDVSSTEVVRPARYWLKFHTSGWLTRWPCTAVVALLGRLTTKV